MLRLTRNFLLVAFIAWTAALASAQSSAPATPVHFYKVTFVIREVDASNKVANSRSYSTMLSTRSGGEPTSIRNGSHMPVKIANGQGLQYIDIGINIDCRRVAEVGQQLSMVLAAEISSIPPETETTSALGPFTRQNRWSSEVVLTPGTPTLVFSADDLSSKGKIQLEVTASPIR